MEKHLYKARQQLGKYRILSRIDEGGFATVYKAYDTIEGIRVALKVPFPHIISQANLEDFRREVSITARLDHPNILHLKSADFIDDQLMVAYPLGIGNLAKRMQKRMNLNLCLSFSQQLLEALAYAHKKHIIHCDVKPENFILFENNQLRLGDFGLAKITIKTMMASGSGTVGYLSPEQAMGRPSFRSDVFSAGLIIYQMLSGQLPTWPFKWPSVGFDRLKIRVNKDMVTFLKRAICVDENKRFDNATLMLSSFLKIKQKVKSDATRKRRRNTQPIRRDWESARQKEFKRLFTNLELHFNCSKCNGPLSETMLNCPWCGDDRKLFREKTQFARKCKRCHRGIKREWKFCPWCYGAAQGPHSTREYADSRYQGRCHACRKELFPFMHYCPWCNRKVKRRWLIDDAKGRCPNCNWSVVNAYWSWCPWCARKLK